MHSLTADQICEGINTFLTISLGSGMHLLTAVQLTDDLFCAVISAFHTPSSGSGMHQLTAK
jgi:hypothetical protein